MELKRKILLQHTAKDTVVSSNASQGYTVFTTLESQNRIKQTGNAVYHKHIPC